LDRVSSNDNVVGSYVLGLMMARGSIRLALRRLRERSWPVVQTAGAAVAAYLLAGLVLDADQPVFASIAAVVALGATHGQRSERARELIGGVVLGIAVGDLIVAAIGTGPPQMGLMVVLAMGAAILLGGGPVLVTEAAVSAILLSSLAAAADGFPPPRLLEALIGGGVALAVHSLVFPPDPVQRISRAAHSVLGELGRTLEEVGSALADGDSGRAGAALQAARGMDERVRALEDALELGYDTARSAPVRRQALRELDRQERMARHLDYAVRNTRVLARHGLRCTRSERPAPAELPEAIQDLSRAVWALSVQVDEPAAVPEARGLAVRGAGRAMEAYKRDPDLAQTEIVPLVRSTATDLVRASRAGAVGADAPTDVPTEELLAEAA
jgi:uncharacterized membrane protein YgaE (UPF0421/DUF939 family)